MIDIETIDRIKAEIRKMIAQKQEHIVYSVDSMDKLQYSRGQLSSCEELLQVVKDLLKKEDIEDDDDPGKSRRV